jgi:hypothetical protein
MIGLIASMLLAGPTTQPTSVPTDEHGLPMPTALGAEQARAGNPLGEYLELVKHEQEYDKSDQWRSMYWDIRGTRESFLGDTRDAQASFDRIEEGHATRAKKGSPLDAMEHKDAAEYILSVADKHQVIMLSERHHVPQTRIVSTKLLQGLWDRGFRYLALETLENRPDKIDPNLNRRTYPLIEDGFYTKEPVFGDMVRQARRIGFTLVPYEATEAIKVARDPDNPNKAQNAREREEAENIKRNILDKDPRAKIFVHCGMGHASKSGGKGADERGDEWVPMAKAFWEITGIEPFTIDEQSALYERTKPELENGLWRYVNDKGYVNGPTVFVRHDGSPYTMLPGSYDVGVFLPRVKYERGRPDWLARDLRRQAVEIPQALCVGAGMRLVQAFYADEPDTAVPIDQILIRPDQPMPVLMLPKGNFRVRTWDETGKVVATGELRT